MIKRAVAALAGLALALTAGGCATTAPASPNTHPMAVAHLPHGPFTVYVLNQGSGTVTPISTATNKAGSGKAAGRSGMCRNSLSTAGVGPITDAQMVALVAAHGGQAAAGWWDQVRPYSLGWVSARLPGGALVGFVNVAWDGGGHAVLLDTKVAGEYQRRGFATALVGHAGHAVWHAKAAGCEWLHVDFEARLAEFYFDACGFRPTPAGVIHLPRMVTSGNPWIKRRARQGLRAVRIRPGLRFTCGKMVWSV